MAYVFLFEYPTFYKEIFITYKIPLHTTLFLYRILVFDKKTITPHYENGFFSLKQFGIVEKNVIITRSILNIQKFLTHLMQP